MSESDNMPPIRLMLDQYLEDKRISDANISYVNWSTSNEETNRRLILLKPLFNELTRPFISTELAQNIQKLVMCNGESKKSSGGYSSYTRFVMFDKPKLCLQKRPQDFFRIAQETKGTFKDWDTIIDDNETFDTDALNLFPDISSTDYLPSINVCQLVGKTLNDSKQKIYLPVDAAELFNAMALAQDQGALLSFEKPKILSATPVALSVSKPHLRRKTASQPLKIGNSS